MAGGAVFRLVLRYSRPEKVSKKSSRGSGGPQKVRKESETELKQKKAQKTVNFRVFF